MVCEHKYEVAVVVASECALGVPLRLGAVANNIWRWTVILMSRGPKRLRLSEFVQISEFFSIYITDICQTSESFAKSVNLK